MEKLLYFFIHYGTPLLILYLLWKTIPKSKLGFFLSIIFQINVLFLLFLWGQYALVGFYYFRYLLLVIILFAVFTSFSRWKPDNNFYYLSKVFLFKLSILFIASSFSIYLNLNALIGLHGNVEPEFNLNFPLHNGKFYISSGGATAIVNNHFRDYPNSQQYAIDINQINNIIGSISNNIFSDSSSYHIIYGQTIYSPCSGKVLKARNNIDDNEVVNMNVKHKYGKGNFITLDCDGTIVSLLHLKKGSVLVKNGDLIAENQIIGKVGNSGFSMEPHLHIQAARYNRDSVLIGIPVTFENKWLVRNDIVNKPF